MNMSRRSILAAIAALFFGRSAAHASGSRQDKYKIKNTDAIFTVAVIVDPPKELVAGGPISSASFTKAGGQFLLPGQTITLEDDADSEIEVWAFVDSLGEIIVFSGNHAAVTVTKRLVVNIGVDTVKKKTTIKAA